jgi:hypothetical protein
MGKITYYISAEEYDLLSEEQLDCLDADYWYDRYLKEKEMDELNKQIQYYELERV